MGQYHRNTSNRRAVCEKQNDVVVAILAALREYQDEISVQVSACGALAVLSCNDDIIVAVVHDRQLPYRHHPAIFARPLLPLLNLSLCDYPSG